MPPRALAAGSLCLLMAALMSAAQDQPKAAKAIPLAVNTEADEDEPHVVGTTLYYASSAGGKFTLLQSTRANPLYPWSKGKALETIGTEVDDKSVYFYAERSGFQYLFFATKKDAEGNNFDIYAAQRFDARKPFSAPTPVQAVCTDADELHPWLTADGKSLYFSRKTKDGWRVFVASRPEPRGPGGFKEPKLVAELPAGFHHATLSADGRTMYLQGPLENDRWGLFVSVKTGTTWGPPEPLDLVNNAEGPTGDRSPALSRPDGLLLYFASDRPGGKGGLDLYAVPTNQLRSKK